MKQTLLIFLIALCASITAEAQIAFSATTPFCTGAPTGAPSAQGSRFRIDLLTGRQYAWSPTSSNWLPYGQGFDVTVGGVPPAYAPGIGQSNFAVNGSNELYRYSGSGTDWDCLNCAGGATYTAGTGIAISGDNVISNTGDLSNTNEIQALSFTYPNLSLSNGGGSVNLSGLSDGDGLYSHDGTIPNTRHADIGTPGAGWMDFGTVYNVPDGVTSVDNGAFAVVGFDGLNYSLMQTIPSLGKIQFGSFNDDQDFSVFDFSKDSMRFSIGAGGLENMSMRMDNAEFKIITPAGDYPRYNFGSVNYVADFSNFWGIYSADLENYVGTGYNTGGNEDLSFFAQFNNGSTQNQYLIDGAGTHVSLNQPSGKSMNVDYGIRGYIQQNGYIQLTDSETGTSNSSGYGLSLLSITGTVDTDPQNSPQFRYVGRAKSTGVGSTRQLEMKSWLKTATADTASAILLTQFRRSASGTGGDSITVLSLSSRGRLGVKTDSPTHELDVNGNARFRGRIIDSNNSAGVPGQLLSTTSTGTDWVDVTYSGSFSGIGTATTTFTVTIGATQPNNTYKAQVTPTSALSAAVFYVTNKTTTTFDVTYLAGLTGTVTFDWSIFP